MKVPFVHVCDYASVSQDQKLTVAGIFDRIFAPSIPYVHPSLYLAFDVQLEASELGRPLSIEVKAVDADGKQLLALVSNVNVHGSAKPGEQPHFPRVLNLNMMPINAVGRYAFDIFINGNRLNGAMIDVVLAGKPEGGNQPPGLRK